jgi:hypothetical protein
MKTLTVLTCAVILTGCATTTFTKPGATAEDFERDRAACRFAAHAAGDPILAMLAVPDCLRGKGWVRE